MHAVPTTDTIWSPASFDDTVTRCQSVYSKFCATDIVDLVTLVAGLIVILYCFAGYTNYLNFI